MNAYLYHTRLGDETVRCCTSLHINQQRFRGKMETQLAPIMENPFGSTGKGTFTPDKFKFDLESLIQFLFPTSLQHPLVAGRLFVFALCGPLDENLCIRTGFQGKRILAEYELEQMCMQMEREDIVQIYLHKSR
ncbi:MAG: hypothetical protein WBJ81_04015, partial [Rickettsiales bacterium]